MSSGLDKRIRTPAPTPDYVCKDATVSRVTATDVYVTVDAYDSGLEYGPVVWVSGGQVPIVGRACTAIFTDSGQVIVLAQERPAVFVGMIVITNGASPGPGWVSAGTLVDEGLPLWRFTGDRQDIYP